MGSDTNYDNLPVAAPGETVGVRPPGISPRLWAAGPSLPENGRRLAKKGALDHRRPCRTDLWPDALFASRNPVRFQVRSAQSRLDELRRSRSARSCRSIPLLLIPVRPR